MRRALAIFLLLLPVAPVSASDVRVDQTVTIEIGADGVERIKVVVHGQNAFPESIRVPPDVNVTRVLNFATPIEFEVQDTGVDRIVRPKGHSFDWTVEATRPRNASIAPIVLGSYFVGAFTVRNDIRIAVHLPPGAELIDTTLGAVDAARSTIRVASNTTTDLRFAYREALDPAKHVEVREGIFASVGPSGRAEEMRMVARIASRATTEAAAFAGLPVKAPIWVRYAPAEVFDWQDGFATGVNVLVVRESDLERSSLVGFPWDPAGVLTHEAFHAVSIPRSSGTFGTNATWWTEGAAVHAERFATGVSGFSSCEGLCQLWQTQIRRETLEGLYAAGGALDPTWTTAASSSLDRTRSYALSGFAVAAYVANYGRDAYARAWSAFRNATTDPSACPCDHRLVERILASAAGRESLDELYSPYRTLYATDRDAFARAVAPLVAGEPAAERPAPLRYPLSPHDDVAPWRPRLVLDDPAVGARRPAGIELSLRYHDLAPFGLTPMPLDDRPMGRLRIVLDGVEVAPVLLHRNGSVVFTLPATTGPHDVRVDAVSMDRNVTLTSLERRLTVPPLPHLELVARPDGTALASVTDGPAGAPIAGLEVRFDLDEVPAYVALSDAKGRAVLPAIAAPGAYLLYAQVYEAGTPGSFAYAELLVPEPTPPSSAPVPPPDPPAPEAPSPTPEAVSPTTGASPARPSRPTRPTPPDAEADVAFPAAAALLGLLVVARLRRRP